jgi:hypothetical protein
MTKKPILCLDFDGCIHSYSSGWKGDEVISDPPVPGIFDWLEAALIYFEIHVYSSRSKTYQGRVAMQTYIRKHAGPHSTIAARLYYANEKPHAFLTIDDRCMRFDGDWHNPMFDPQTLLKFVPWYKKQVSS